jgi:hypothetical protein
MVALACPMLGHVPDWAARFGLCLAGTQANIGQLMWFERGQIAAAAAGGEAGVEAGKQRGQKLSGTMGAGEGTGNRVHIRTFQLM